MSLESDLRKLRENVSLELFKAGASASDVEAYNQEALGRNAQIEAAVNKAKAVVLPAETK